MYYVHVVKASGLQAWYEFTTCQEAMEFAGPIAVAGEVQLIEIKANYSDAYLDFVVKIGKGYLKHPVNSKGNTRLTNDWREAVLMFTDAIREVHKWGGEVCCVEHPEEIGRKNVLRFRYKA